MRRIATAGLFGVALMMWPGASAAQHGRYTLSVTPTDAQLARRSPLAREAARLIDSDADDRGLALWSLYIGLLRQGDAAVTRWALELQSVVRSRKGNYLHACWWVLREHSPRRARIFAAALARRGVAIGPDSGHYENLESLEREPPPPPLPERVGRTPIGYYVDDFIAVVYDLSYRPERKGQASKWLQVKYDDGTELDIDIRLISDNIDGAQNQSLGRMALGAGGRLYPLRMDRLTTPYLWNAKHAALTAMRRSNEQFALIVTMAQASVMTVLPTTLVQPVQMPTAPAVSARPLARPSGGSAGAAAPASAAQPRAPPRSSLPTSTSAPPKTSVLRRRVATPGKRVSKPRKASAKPRKASAKPRKASAKPRKASAKPRKASAKPRKASAKPPRDANGMTAGDRVRRRNHWPPEKPTGPKPRHGEPGAAEWRYQLYRYKVYRAGRGPETVIPFDKWKRGHFVPGANGGRPGRPGGKAHVEDVERNNRPNRLEPGWIGRNYPDGIGQPGQTVTIRGQKIVPRRGGRVIVEADHFYTDGSMPIARARTKIRAIRRTEPNSTIVVTNVDRPDAPPLVYPPGTQAPPPGPLPRGTKPIIPYP